MKKSYVLIQDFKAPYVVATGMAHNPSKIMLKKYVKGQIVEGQIIISKGQPSILLVAGIIGAILGAGAVYLAEKQNIIATPDKKYKLYGAVAGAVLGMYIVYRKK